MQQLTPLPGATKDLGLIIFTYPVFAKFVLASHALFAFAVSNRKTTVLLIHGFHEVQG